MAVGVQAWNASGVKTLDIDSKIAKFLGTAQIGNTYTGTTASGTITDSRFTAYSGHTPFVFLVSGSVSVNGNRASFSFAGNVLTWSFPNNVPGTPATRPDTTFVYGIA
jgi:hypothetical protein